MACLWSWRCHYWKGPTWRGWQPRSRRSSLDSRTTDEVLALSGRRSRIGVILAGGVLVAAGFAVAIVEMLRLPKGTIWIVVAAAAVLLTVIRAPTRYGRAPDARAPPRADPPAGCPRRA